MKFLYIVHTTRHPAQAWAFASETKARRLLITLQNGGAHQDARLTKAPLNPSASSHLRTTITFDWQGRTLCNTTPAPFPTLPPEPFFTIHPYHQISSGEPWTTCRLETSKGPKGLRQASEKAAQTVADMKSMGLWPATQEEAQALSDHTLQNFGTPSWFENPPPLPASTSQPKGILSGLLICPTHNLIMVHQQHQDERFYLCPGSPQRICANAVKDVEELETTVLIQAVYHLQPHRPILDLALSAELAEPPQDQRSLNTRLAADAVRSAREVLQTLENTDPEHTAKLHLPEFTATLIKHLEQAAAVGSSTAEAIARSSPPGDRNSTAALHRHNKNCLMTNPTPANMRTVSDLLRVIDPTPGRETITWRLPPKGKHSLLQKVDQDTFIQEVVDGLYIKSLETPPPPTAE